MTKKIIILLSWVTVLATMIIIFSFSQENMEDSANTSSSVTEEILEIVLPKEEITQQKIREFHPTVRTMAHFGIFMLLGFALSNAFIVTTKLNFFVNYILAFLSSILYAILDEYHQKFTGRVPEFTDVLIDSLGALIGILLFALFFHTFTFIIKRKNKSVL